MQTMNMASRPFGRHRLFWSASVAAGVLLIATAIGLVAFWLQYRDPAPELMGQEGALGAQFQQLAAREAEIRRTLDDPANAEVLDRSRFLNLLLFRKGISWTKTFSDLEEIMPPRVLMTDIRPEVDFENQVRLEMRVGAETPADMIEFVKALEESDLFGVPNVHGSSPPNENQPLFQYQVTVRYEQGI